MCDGRAPVNRIIPCSLVDGPGSRTAVFFQGCGFSCRYCHNPETMRECIGCGACVGVCPTEALTAGQGTVSWDKSVCCGCDACIQACPNRSSPKVRRMTVDEVMEEIGPSLPFIAGITVSGGECTRQARWLPGLFERVRRLGKTAFVDTNGQTDFREMPELTKAMDFAMLDVKSADEEEHRSLTGQGCAVVLSNARYLTSVGKLYEVRTVIAPGLLDGRRTVEAVAGMIAGYPEVRYKLIAYRPWGVRPPLEDVPVPGRDRMEELRGLAEGLGVRDVVIT